MDRRADIPGDGNGVIKTDSIDLGTEDDKVYLTFYGTGFRHGWADWGPPTAVIDKVWVPVVEMGAHSTAAGVDLMVIGPIPRTLAGRKNVDAIFTFWNSSTSTNPVKVSFSSLTNRGFDVDHDDFADVGVYR